MNKNGRVGLRVKTKNRVTRTFVDANIICEAVVEIWDDLADALKGLSDKERSEIIDYFNTFIEGEEDLGDVL